MKFCIVYIKTKIAAFVLIVAYTLPSTATFELLKLPLLASHYTAHLAQNKNIGFLSFLTTHYYTENGTDKDAAEDNKLPFKSKANFEYSNLVSLAPPSIACLSLQPAVLNDKNYFIRTDVFISSQYLANIWQPPRKTPFR